MEYGLAFAKSPRAGWALVLTAADIHQATHGIFVNMISLGGFAAAPFVLSRRSSEPYFTRVVGQAGKLAIQLAMQFHTSIGYGYSDDNQP